MTSIAELIAAGRTWSLEFFPPRDAEAAARFRASLGDFADLGPSFASVTYGALGSTRERTRDMVIAMNADLGFPTMPHLTCIGHARAEVAELLDTYAEAGVRDILALGGDPPADGSELGDFRHAIELVELVKAHPAGFTVGVAAHPELHPRSPDRASDRRHLADKLSLADFAITQFFFRVDDYSRMRDELAALGCHRPVLPGVMPFVSVPGLARMAGMNGTSIPPELSRRLEPVAGDAEAVTAVGVEVAAALCARLIAEEVPGIHLYTLNRTGPVGRVWGELGLQRVA